MTVFEQILQYIQNAIPELTSSSKSALFYNLANAVAGNIDNTITEIENTKTIIATTTATQRFGRAGYYVTVAKAFQLGDDLIPNTAPNLDPVYEVISDDPTVLIIKQASYEVQTTEGGAIVGIMKVATEDGNGELIPLSGVDQPEETPEQLAYFKNYIVQFEILGIPIQVVSLEANELAYTIDIVYNKAYDLPSLQENVLTAENNFKKNFIFNGYFFVDQLSNYIKENVPGVISCNISDTTLDGSPLAGVVIDGITFENATALTSGYFNYGTITRNYGGI